MTRWTCPTCRMWVEMRITPRHPPTCRHGGTRHDAKRPSQMTRDEEEGE